jgi:serine-type D-Ala-D-Ala carboxypeptidase (penicillin-binding protein 5/6)
MRMSRRGEMWGGRRARLLAMTLAGLLATLLTGCGGLTYGGEAPFTSAAHPVPTAPVTLPKAAVPKIDASAAVLLNATTHEIYVSQSGDTELAMASTTKIMTALVAIRYGKLDQQVTIGADAIKMQNNENSTAQLQQGDVLTLSDLLYGLMLPSGDDAAVAVADAVAGSPEHFVGLMNLEAALLGLQRTHYVNVHGLDATGHYTTATDLGRLAGYAMADPSFAKIVATPEYKLKATSAHHEYDWITTNDLVSSNRHYAGIVGVKTGHTGNAGYCLVFAVARPQGTLIGVLLGDSSYDPNARFIDAAHLLDWGYAGLK